MRFHSLYQLYKSSSLSNTNLETTSILKAEGVSGSPPCISVYTHITKLSPPGCQGRWLPPHHAAGSERRCSGLRVDCFDCFIYNSFYSNTCDWWLACEESQSCGDDIWGCRWRCNTGIHRWIHQQATVHCHYCRLFPWSGCCDCGCGFHFCTRRLRFQSTWNPHSRTMAFGSLLGTALQLPEPQI